MDTPHSRSSVTLQLELIQKRCAELLEESSEVDELTLAETDEPRPEPGDYFQRG
ncbi:MAG: hypothetical protein OEW35_19525 [Gammaproteobacteria bacterium]|nr:hypothetical protein [Gammaproteobacteria bacterium]MDH4256735.1 hypothetical protein [Gammaproteobacteria bacterium]MDH5312053.1 hypothetical protein [Gammaproteobacteria bacterium]